MAPSLIAGQFRHQFHIPQHNGKEQVYFLGNSLGLQPVASASSVNKVFEQWANLGVEGFFEGESPWMRMHQGIASSMAEIVGALPDEISVMNQLTVNLHLLMTSFYRPSSKKYKIICEGNAFPSDQYMLASHVRLHGLNTKDTIIEIHPRAGETNIFHDDILTAIHEHRNETALVFFSGVNYYNGQVFNIAEITKAAHDAGAIAGFDLAHAAGNIKLKLHDWDVDFACWCNYKYLNAGPGSVATAFIHERFHGAENLPRLAGWWGNREDTRFLMKNVFEPANSAAGWQVSTPSPVQLAMLKSSLDIFHEAGMPQLAQQGWELSGYLVDCLEELKHKLKILTPAERGCQVSISINKDEREVFGLLRKNGIFADWREPAVIRVAPVPLYNTKEEVELFSRTLKKLLS